MFSYCRYACFPQIPYVQDVLRVLLLAREKDVRNCYSPEGVANWPTYIANLMLVAAAVASKVFYMERYDEAKARKMIAEAILELCPPEAQCLFHDAFVEAQEIVVGQRAPSRDADREMLLATCSCPECARIRSEEGQGFEHDDRHRDEPEDLFDSYA